VIWIRAPATGALLIKDTILDIKSQQKADYDNYILKEENYITYDYKDYMI